MAGVAYQHIGHDPRFGELAMWNLDDRGELAEDRRSFREAGERWLDWSHQRLFEGRTTRARGRVELGTRTGSVFIVDPNIGLASGKLARILRTLDRKYPNTRWFLFGCGYHGESVVGRSLLPA